METPGTLAALRDRVAAARSAWLARCSGDGGQGGWDVVVITAANERQAEGYRIQMAERERAGLWPLDRPWRVVADPDGRRIGSGLATCHAMRALREEGLQSERMLILHCGGGSVRMPHASAFGKVFVPLPAPLTDNRATTVLDENLAMLELLAAEAPPGVMLAAGDVLVVLGPAAFAPDRAAVCTVAAPAEAGEGHGVFLAQRPVGRVRRILQKCPADVLLREGAADAARRVLIDTGVFLLPPPLAALLLDATDDTTAPLGRALAGGAEIDVYTDFAEAMAEQTDRAAYLDAVDGLRRTCREQIWGLLHGRWPLHISTREPGAFYHVGSTRAYIEALRPESDPAAVYGFQPAVASGALRAARATLIGCRGAETGSIGDHAVLDSCALSPGCMVERDAFAGRLGAHGAFLVGEALAAFSVPLRLGDGFRAAKRRGKRAVAAAIYGVDDNPKLRFADPAATFLNQPFAAWMQTRGLAPADLWPEGVAASLWTARLFPVEEDAAALRWLTWFQQRPEAVDVRGWRDAARVSLAEMFELADCERLVSGAEEKA